MSLPSDSDQGVPPQSPVSGLADAKLRASAFYAAKATSDINAGKVLPVTDPISGKRRYETSPVSLSRLMGSPLKTEGSPYTVILRGVPVRLVASGWNDTRSANYDDKIDTNRRHGGLDFTAPVGENVLAVADGTISFVGVQHRVRGGVYLENAHTDTGGNVLSSQNAVAVPVGEVGFGGIFVQITHTGVFQGFRTEYMHLATIPIGIVRGKKVKEGDVIGVVGLSGGYRGVMNSGSHLHWQARFDNIVVKPESLVLHYNPKSPSDAPGSDILAETLTQLYRAGRVSAGEAVILGAAASSIRGQNRAVAMENQSASDIKRRASEHSTYLAKSLAVEAGVLHQAIAQFQAGQSVVSNPMTYNFDKGLWSDGKVV